MLIPLFGLLLIYRIFSQEISNILFYRSSTFMHAVAASFARHGAADVDLSWHAPNLTAVNNLPRVIAGSGVYGFIYNSSVTPDSEYGRYNWGNMPHVRATEYKKPPAEYKLQYVEVVSLVAFHRKFALTSDTLQIHRHHKRTVYVSNSFPVESYGWNCDDEGLFYYGKPKTGGNSARTYWQGYVSPTNPFRQSGFLGSCQFPQITAEGLDDSWQHGKDLYGVYHDMLGFLPEDSAQKVSFKVTQNVITSQVAGMVINGMFGTEVDYPLLVEV